MILHTQINGTGEPIVLIHQALQTSKTDFPDQREFFSKNFQVVQVDLRGHGNSVTDDYSNYFEQSAMDLQETLKSLNIQQAHIIGSSLGSLVGLVFAKRFPEMVTSITLSGIIPEKPDNWAELSAEETEQENAIAESEEAVAYFNEIHKGNWKSLLKSFQSPDWYPFDETGDIASLKMPVLFLVGEGNPLEVIGTVKYPKMNETVHVSVIPYAGHLPHLEQPEIYNHIVEAFLAKTKEQVSQKV